MSKALNDNEQANVADEQGYKKNALKAKPYRSARFLLPSNVRLLEQAFPYAMTITEPTLVHRASRVLRLKPDDRLTLIDPVAEVSARAKVESLSKTTLTVTIEHLLKAPEGLPTMIVLAGVLKGPRWEWLIEKATELGARVIVPVLSEHSVVKMTTTQDIQKKQSRWQATAFAAVEQCDGRFIPTLESPSSLTDAIQLITQYSKNKNELKLVMNEGGDDRKTLKQQINQFKKPASLVLAVGPEGGWSGAETKQMRQSGFLPTRLGSRILKAETAVMSALSLIVSEYDMADGEGLNI